MKLRNEIVLNIDEVPRNLFLSEYQINDDSFVYLESEIWIRVFRVLPIYIWKLSFKITFL